MRTWKALWICVIVGGAGTAADAQSCGAWTQRSTGGGPSAREGAAFAFDPLRGVSVLFGGGLGNPANPTLSDTWEWNGSGWSMRPVSGPSSRLYSQMVFDTSRGRLLLFGGRTGAGLYSGETWEFDGSVWTLRASIGPSARAAFSLAFDSQRGRAVLFGGQSAGAAYLGDTWEWDGSAWSLRSTTGPSPRRYHSAAFDPTTGRTVLFGGDAGSASQADTWIWNGTTWAVLAAPAAPIGRWGHALSSDGLTGRTLLFGGYRGGPLGDTWEGDGETWQFRLSSGPAPRDHPSMTFDTVRGRFVLFGGYSGRNSRSSRCSRRAPPRSRASRLSSAWGPHRASSRATNGVTMGPTWLMGGASRERDPRRSRSTTPRARIRASTTLLSPRVARCRAAARRWRCGATPTATGAPSRRS